MKTDFDFISLSSHIRIVNANKLQIHELLMYMDIIFLCKCVRRRVRKK